MMGKCQIQAQHETCMWCRRVQVGASRRLRAQLGRHAVRGRDMECLYELLLMAIIAIIRY